MIVPHNYGRYYDKIITDVTGMEKFWNEVTKLGALEKFVLIVDVHEGMAKARNRVMGFFSNKLNSVVGHKVEFEVLERDHSKPLSLQITLVI